MAFSAVGLQTHIWNNNAKSVLLLLGYPFLLLVMTWAFFFGLALISLYAPEYGTGSFAPATSPYSHAAGVADATPWRQVFTYSWQGVTSYSHVVFILAAVWLCIAWMFHQRLINYSTGARPISRKEQPRLYNLLENLCISRGLPTPKLHIIDSPVMNAYASGISQSSYAITLTTGLINALDEDELEAVIAHELTHIINRDVRLLVIGVIFAGMISFFAEMIWRTLIYGSHGRSRGDRKGGGAMMIVAAVVLVIGYLFSIVIRMAISRRREYLADAGAVELTKNPDAMVSALRKISGNAKMEDVPAEVQQMFIENPPGIFGAFSTHPPIESRIDALIRYAAANDYVLRPPRPAPEEDSAATPPSSRSSRNPWKPATFRNPWQQD